MIVNRVCFFVLAAAVMSGVSGCGGRPEEAGEAVKETGRGQSFSQELPGKIPAYPGAEEIEYPDGYAVLGEGVKTYAFETSDGLDEVYRFYIERLPETGLEPSGDIIMGGNPFFVLEVTRDGADYAIIQAGEAEEKTRVVIWHSIGG